MHDEPLVLIGPNFTGSYLVKRDWRTKTGFVSLIPVIESELNKRGEEEFPVIKTEIDAAIQKLNARINLSSTTVDDVCDLFGVAKSEVSF